MKGRTAFVTGASQGIGRACALDLARAGARVIVGARQQDKLTSLVEEIRAAGGSADAVPLDVASRDSVKQAFSKARELAERVDILVNNAGVTRDGLAARMSAENWDEVLNVNLSGAFACIQAVLRPMMKARWGRIINISSVVAESGNPGQANYAASKAGLVGMTKSLAQELAPRNITVNAVAPGLVETAMTDALGDEVKEKLLESIPLRRIGSADEVAYAVRFLAADEASYITGHVLQVNGGLYM